MSRIKSILASLLLVLAFTSPVFAQSATEPAPTPAPIVLDVPANADTVIIPLDAPDVDAPVTPAPPDQGILEAALALFIKAVTDITFLPVAAGFVVVMTALTKRLLPAIGGAVIALAWQVVAWVAWVLALHFGYAAQFSSWIDSLTTILTAVAGLLGSSLLATAAYNRVGQGKTSIIGYKRS